MLGILSLELLAPPPAIKLYLLSGYENGEILLMITLQSSSPIFNFITCQ